MNRQSAIARFRRAEKDAAPPKPKTERFIPYPSSYEHGRAMREVGLSLEEMLIMVRREGNDEAEFTRGFNGFPPCVHFVGFRGEEYWSAVRVFGEPDIFHRYWDHRAIGDIAPGDTVVFAKGDESKPPNVYAFNDSEQF